MYIRTFIYIYIHITYIYIYLYVHIKASRRSLVGSESLAASASEQPHGVSNRGPQSLGLQVFGFRV